MNDNRQERGSGQPYEYVMPLSGQSPKRTAPAGSVAPKFEVSLGFSPSSKIYQNRRSSNQTDATPRFQNISRSERFEEQPSSPASPVKRTQNLPIPESLPLYNEEPSQTTNLSYTAEDASFAEGSYTGGGSISSVSGPHSGSVGYADRSQNRDSRRDATAMHLGMDGRVREVPIRSPKTVVTSYSDSTGSHQQSSKLPPDRKLALQESALNPLKDSNHSASIEALENDEDNDAASSQGYNDSIEPVVFWGIVFPMWLSQLVRKPPSLSRISVFIVTVAPCFWCSRNSVQSGSAGTNRTVLTRLNVLVIFISLLQVVAAAWLAVLLLVLDDGAGILQGIAPHFWNINGAVWSVGFLALILMATCLCTIRVIKVVDLVGAIRHFWLVLWLLPFEIFFTVSMFDRYDVTNVWIRHWWGEDNMSFFRDFFCAIGTADEECKVPVDGGPDFANEELYCEYYYNQTTTCRDIRDTAQEQAEAAFMKVYNGIAGSGCVLLFLMFCMMNALEKIISKPIVQKSRETNVPLWLLLPTAGNALVGTIFVFSPSSLLNTSISSQGAWIGIIYLVAAGLFLIALLMGWFLSTFSIQSSSDKKNKNVAVAIFIGVMAANTVLLATIFVASIMFSGNLLLTPITESARGTVACYIDDDGVSCTNCEYIDDLSPEEICPEWTLDEVTRILRTQLKQSATLAAIFILYAISVLRFGFVLRKHLAMYQIDYV